MKRTLYGIICLCVLASCSKGIKERVDVPNSAETPITDKYFVNEKSAEELASDFFGGTTPIFLGSDASIQTRAGEAEPSIPSYYIYGGQEGGYIIISASEVAYPVLGYSREGNLDPNNLPCALEMLLGVYSGNINKARELRLEPSDEIRTLRSSLRANSPIGNIVVNELMPKIKWNQDPYYNDLCPSGTPVGCVATSTAQIMRFWEYPSKAMGSYSYASPNFGTLSHDYNYKLNWDAMPKEVLNEPNYEVARFCYGIAVALNMNFDYGYNGGSGAYPSAVAPALIRFYSYPKSLTFVMRYQYEFGEWLAMMKNELDNGRPIQYGGSGKGGGHSFVLDGYDSESYFHVNWGWGGQSDGWFRLDALDPNELGTGGGTGGFNNNQTALINIAPPVLINGDNSGAVIDEEDEDEDEGVVIPSVLYKEVYALNTGELFLRYTRFNNLETSSGGTGYATFFNKYIEATAGGKIDFALAPVVTVAGMNPAYVIAVDYNADGTFDITKTSIEIVKAYKAKNNDPYVGSFTIPANQAKGVYRMRVLISNGLYNPNKPLMRGEYEDYLINIK